jgi:hypothetical protein
MAHELSLVRDVGAGTHQARLPGNTPIVSAHRHTKLMQAASKPSKIQHAGTYTAASTGSELLKELSVSTHGYL